MRDLAAYTPVLCGTIPIAIDVEGSDLDIVMEEGIKTEPAFARLLGLDGDPYEALLELGRELGLF